MNNDWRTWSPLQSPDVREICSHMSKSERAEAVRRGGYYGLWVVATLAGPVFVGLTFTHPVLLTLAVSLITLHMVSIPSWLRRQRKFLCSTKWASERGLSPDQLRLFTFTS